MNPMMMKKVQKLQRDMVKAQQEIEQSVFTGSAAGGMVTVEATGKTIMRDKLLAALSLRSS